MINKITFRDLIFVTYIYAKTKSDSQGFLKGAGPKDNEFHKFLQHSGECRIFTGSQG